MTKSNELRAPKDKTPQGIDFSIGLSLEEKRDLEKMILEFQKERSRLDNTGSAPEDARMQIDRLNQRLAYLTSRFLDFDRRLQALYEAIRLTCEKSELINQRVNGLLAYFDPKEHP